LNSLARGPASTSRQLDGFVDSLLQSFENCRPGLSDAMQGSAGEPADVFFTRLYEKEAARLKDTIRLEESLLSKEAREDYFGKIDDLVRKVLIPGYVRFASRFTKRERNAFYLAPEPFHGLERLAWGLAGALLGAFIVWAPFIPIWSKYLILPFAIGGLFFPNIRRFLMVRSYESELNRLVAKTDAEIARIDTHYLSAGEALPVLEAPEAAASREAGRRAEAAREGVSSRGPRMME
jgi:hypothetical protein